MRFIAIISLIFSILQQSVAVNLLKACLPKEFRRLIPALLGSALIGAAPICIADSRQVADIPTSGIIFKDSLKISAFNDPKVEGVTLYLADFERPLTEKLQKDFFNDPSSSSLTCLQTGPIIMKDINKGQEGEEVFEESRNLFFKQIKVKRVFDKSTNTLVYASFSSKLDKGTDNNKSRFKASLCAVHIN